MCDQLNHIHSAILLAECASIEVYWEGKAGKNKGRKLQDGLPPNFTYARKDLCCTPDLAQCLNILLGDLGVIPSNY